MYKLPLESWTGEDDGSNNPESFLEVYLQHQLRVKRMVIVFAFFCKDMKLWGFW